VTSRPQLEPNEARNLGATPSVAAGLAGYASRRWVRLLLFAGGLALFAAIFSKVGWPAIVSNLSAIGAWFFLLVGLYLFAQLAFCLGWWVLIDPLPPLSRFPRLFGVYLAGDTVNYLSPGSFAGEPLKARLLAGTLPGSALASVTIYKHADMVAQWFFVLAGVGAALWRFPLPAAARWAAVAGLAGLGALLGLLTWAVFRGTYGPIVARLSRWKRLEARATRWTEAARQVDASIRAFYADHRGRYFAAVGWNLLGWCGGLLETYIVLRLLTRSEGWWTAFAVETLAMALNTMLLWVPARAGSAEGVRVAVFVLLGLPAAQGAAYSLARRARELAWILPGAIYLVTSPLRRGPARTPKKKAPSFAEEAP
jgi:uncharacterized protein (TIRG00374 family)